jgi:hypothetical protein
MELALKKARLIQWAMLATIPLLAAVAEIAGKSGSGAWTLWHLVAIGMATWSATGAFLLRNKLVSRSVEKLMINPADAKAARQWEVGQIISLAMAEGVAMWGLALRMALGGTLAQAGIFYAVSLFLLVLWTPRMPEMTGSAAQSPVQ